MNTFRTYLKNCDEALNVLHSMDLNKKELKALQTLEIFLEYCDRGSIQYDLFPETLKDNE